MADEPRKRSRFDQTEPEPKRPSRFDRRSRSPSAKKSDSRRSRSPIGRGSRSPASKSDPAAAAAAAAARINAQIQAKKGIQHVDVPPIRSVRPPTSIPYVSLPLLTLPKQTGSPAAVKSPSTSGPVSGEVYTQDGDYIKDIEVNDLRNRYTLTKGPTQKMVNTFDHILLILLQHFSVSSGLPVAGAARGLLFFFSSMSCGENVSSSLIVHLAALHSITHSASADLPGVTSRSKRRLAPVRLP